jgi:hypothetical protein
MFHAGWWAEGAKRTTATVVHYTAGKWRGINDAEFPADFAERGKVENVAKIVTSLGITPFPRFCDRLR